VQDFASPLSRSHAWKRDHEPGMGCRHPVVGRRGWHGGEVRHAEHGAPLDPFSDRHEPSSDLDLSLTPSAETIINGRGAGEGVRQSGGIGHRPEDAATRERGEHRTGVAG